MFSKVFLLDVLERFVKTIAQAALALLTMDGVNILNVNTKQLLSSALTAGVISILTSIVSSQVRDKNTASLVVAPPIGILKDDVNSMKG